MQPIKRPGGKRMLLKRILALLPRRIPVYVELFGGSGQVLMSKPRSPVEVFNDLEYNIYNLFRVLQEPDQSEELARLLSVTPHSRAQFRAFEERVDSEPDPVRRAWMFMTMSLQGFGGSERKGWAYERSSYLRAQMVPQRAEYIPLYRDRLLGVYIECADWETVFKAWDAEDTLFFVDPPYYPSTRTGGDMYRDEMSVEDHERLIAKMLAAKGAVMLCGYDNDLYHQLDDAGWDRWTYLVACTVAGATAKMSYLKGAGARVKHQPRTEVIWGNAKLREMRREEVSLLDFGLNGGGMTEVLAEEIEDDPNLYGP